jgi:hypothetical protein
VPLPSRHLAPVPQLIRGAIKGDISEVDRLLDAEVPIDARDEVRTDAIL